MGLSEAREFTEGSVTPTSCQTSEGSITEKAEAAESTNYFKRWRLIFWFVPQVSQLLHRSPS